MPSEAGAIIYKAFAPTLKIWIVIIIGFVITKRGMFPPASARGVSTLSLNIGLPCLIFSSIVTAFSPDNSTAFGSLILMALLYQAIGLACAWFLSEICYVPADFRWGILVMGIISNWGNMPLAVVQTVGVDPPFNGTPDIQLGLAYSSVFILVMNTLLFPFGLHKVCALDFKEENLNRKPAPSLQTRIKGWVAAYRRRRGGGFVSDAEMNEENRSTAPGDDGLELSAPIDSREDKDIPQGGEDHGEHGEEPSELKQRAPHVRYTGGGAPIRKTSRASSFTSMMESTRPIPPTAPLDATDLTVPCQPTISRTSEGPDQSESLPSPEQQPRQNDQIQSILKKTTSATSNSTSLSPPHAGNPLQPVCSNPGHGRGEEYTYHTPATPAPSIRKKSLRTRIWKFIKGFIMPITVAIILGIPCSLILPLKALFTQVDGWSGTRVPNAPNGGPPLGFILDTTTFLGAMSVPTSVLLLGASFGRLKPPERWSDLPIAAVVGMTCVKMIIVPLFSIFVVQGLRDHTHLYPPADKMRIFVAILTSGTPAAINQLVVTQLYNPAGTAHTLAMFLSLQYLAMPVLMTALAAIALYIVEN